MIIAAISPAGVLLYAQGTVQLANVSFPYTSIEVGDYVRVTIAGAARYGTVTVVQNGGAPFNFGKTDASGHWSVMIEETEAYVGDYYQSWYVNGIAIAPNNGNRQLFPWAAALPSFSVAAGALPSSPPILGQVSESCGAPLNVTAKWAWTPVSWESTTSYGSSVPNAAAQNWNMAESKLELTYAPPTEDILVEDSTILPSNVFGATELDSQGCSLCYNDVDICNGSCLGPTAMYYADIFLNTSLINEYATALGAASSTIAAAVVTHELGHTLALGDLYPRYGICSEDKRIMMSGGLLDLCGVSAPTSRDVGAFNSVYTGSPGFCAPGKNVCYLGDSCS